MIDLLARAAFLEFEVARAYSTGRTYEAEPRRPRRAAPPELAPYLSSLAPPRWFVEEELGFRLDSGPSLAWTQRVLALTNARAMRALAAEAPLKFTYPKRRKS